MKSPHDPEHDGLHAKVDEFFDRVEEAAIEAELATGEREESIEEAKAHALVRVARMTLGFVVVIIGIIALPLPGPGWLIIVGGLTILSKDVAWAERLLRYIRKRVPGVPEDGRIPPSSIATMLVVTGAFVAASLWWTLARGSDAVQAGEYAVTSVESAGAAEELAGSALTITIGADGPLLVDDGACTISLAVTDRSKREFTVGDAEPPACAPDADLQRLADGLANSKLELNHDRRGIVDWFLDDDYLSSIDSPTITAGVQATPVAVS